MHIKIMHIAPKQNSIFNEIVTSYLDKENDLNLNELKAEPKMHKVRNRFMYSTHLV